MKSLLRIMVAVCLLPIPAAFSQNLRLPRDPDKLVERVQVFWQSVVSGQRLQAAEFVLPEKKNIFLSGNPVPVVKATVVAVDLTSDRDMATVRVNLSVLGTNLSDGPANWTISDAWIWRRGNWYIDVADASQIFPEARAGQKLDEKKVQDSIDKSFEILRDRIELGKLTDGQHFTIEVPIKYTGEFPLTVEPALPNPVISVPLAPPLTSKAQNLVLAVGTDNWEGPINAPVILNLKYLNVTVERTLTVTGEVFIPLALRQEPANAPLVDGQEFSVYVRNNTDQDVRLRYMSVDAKVDITKRSEVFPAHQETQLTFRKRPGIMPDSVYLQLEAPVNGRDAYTFKFINTRP
jgi:hypothetical protein